MKAEVTSELMYRLTCSGRQIGLFTKQQLWEMRNAIDITLAQKGFDYEQNAIINVVCNTFGLQRYELFKDRRTFRIAWPRQIAMALLYEFTDMSLNEIGDFFGGKDHGTVLHAVRVVQARRPMRNEGAPVRDIEATLAKEREQRVLSESISASSGNGHGMDATGNGSRMDSLRSE